MNLKQKRLHRLTGIALLLPFVVWSLTGIFFLVRPPFFEAYERIPVKSYPISYSSTLIADENWLEARIVRSILGHHLLVRNDHGWHHLRLETLQQWNLPDEDRLTLLLHDAFQFNPERYGNIIEWSVSEGQTSTGIEIKVDWSTLTITQEGSDGLWIDRIYNLHYLRWTGISWLDQIVGIAGLCLLLYMTFSGARMVYYSKN